MSSKNMDIPELTFEEMLASLTNSTPSNNTLNEQQHAGQSAYAGKLNHQQQAFNAPQAFITPQNSVANNFNFHTQRIENAHGNVTHNHHQATPLPMLSHYSDEGLELAIDQQFQRRDRDLRYSNTFQAAPGLQQQDHGFQDHDGLIDQLTANEAASFLSPTLQPNPWAGQQENDFKFGSGSQAYPQYGQANPGTFDPLSPGYTNLQSNQASNLQPMRRVESTRQFFPLNNNHAHQGMGMGMDEHYPAELPTLNASYPGQQMMSNLRFSTQIERPSRPCRQMSFNEPITPGDVSYAAVGDREVIVLDSDLDQEGSHLASDTIAQPQVTATQRALPNWDPAIMDIDSAEAWLKAHPNQLYRSEVPGDDVDEVIRNKVYYAQQIFNALQAPPPPASPRKFPCQAAVDYHNRYHGKALEVINDRLADPDTAKTTQSYAIKVVQMAIDVHLKGVPWSRFERKTSLKLSQTNTTFKCSERLNWIIEAVSRVKTIGQDIVEWNPVQVEELVGNAERILRAKVNSVPVNWKKSTKKHKEEFEEEFEEDQMRRQRRSARRQLQDRAIHDTSSRRPQQTARILLFMVWLPMFTIPY
ncbi:hypothetical protein TI39_contig349g00014 [Zymoseptoria brevis]|uniref:Uncharacterized protein n=1 Tax=Zymoseptoria brevis TaxID=1047168 RepID=A0A0F4GS34_9PEZI|nr:hypothetical protein TI39_contig349g00014 [Zymoseptoria brevis]